MSYTLHMLLEQDTFVCLHRIILVNVCLVRLIGLVGILILILYMQKLVHSL